MWPFAASACFWSLMFFAAALLPSCDFFECAERGADGMASEGLKVGLRLVLEARRDPWTTVRGATGVMVLPRGGDEALTERRRIFDLDRERLFFLHASSAAKARCPSPWTGRLTKVLAPDSVFSKHSGL